MLFKTLIIKLKRENNINFSYLCNKFPLKNEKLFDKAVTKTNVEIVQSIISNWTSFLNRVMTY
jgi:hypothetical protein